MKEKLLAEIIKLLAPGEMNKNFEMVTVNEKKECITITFVEMAKPPPQGLKWKDSDLYGCQNPKGSRHFR